MKRQTCSSAHFFLEGEIVTIVTVGICLAKNIFALHGVDEAGKPALVPITGPGDLTRWATP
jgi:hypothetical protein